MWTYAAFETAAFWCPPRWCTARGRVAARERVGHRARGGSCRAAGGWVRRVPREQLLEPEHLAAADPPAQQAVALAHVDVAEAPSRLRSVVRRWAQLRHPDHGGGQLTSQG